MDYFFLGGRVGVAELLADELLPGKDEMPILLSYGLTTLGGLPIERTVGMSNESIPNLILQLSTVQIHVDNSLTAPKI